MQSVKKQQFYAVNFCDFNLIILLLGYAFKKVQAYFNFFPPNPGIIPIISSFFWAKWEFVNRSPHKL